jgi:uncharacterized protein (DUF488 family)
VPTFRSGITKPTAENVANREHERPAGSTIRLVREDVARREMARTSSHRRLAATVGVYGFTRARFLDALQAADVCRILDVRQRRGVRGSEYAWANSLRLQAGLAEAGIGYRHHPELAPTTELREVQYREDARLGVGKRSRAELAREYRERYTAEILDRVDLGLLLDDLPAGERFALLCVERDPEACHRSIIAERLALEHGVRVTHIRP